MISFLSNFVVKVGVLNSKENGHYILNIQLIFLEKSPAITRQYYWKELESIFEYPIFGILNLYL